MSTAALETSKKSPNLSRVWGLVDLWAAGLALPIFVLAHLPVVGWAVGAGAWFLQRLVQAYFRGKVAESDQPRRVAGMIVGSTLLRAWGIAAVVLILGLQNQKAGLSAALLIVALFTVYFAQSMLTRWMESGAEEVQSDKA